MRNEEIPARASAPLLARIPGLDPGRLLPARPYVVLGVIATLVVSRWFRRGTFIATGDMGPWIRRGWEPEASWSWNHSVTGAGSAAYNIARAAEFATIHVAKAVGSDEYGAQWAFYSAIYGLVAVGVGFVAGAFVRSEVAIVTAGTFAVLNGFFLTRLPNPLNIISVGCIALITGIALRVGQGRPVPPVLGALCLLPTSFLAFNPPMIVVAYVWALAGTPLLVALTLGRRPLWRLLRWFVVVAPWAVAVNLWWLVPFAQSYLGGGGAASNATFQDPMNWSWAQINNTVPNVLTLTANWAWFLPQYLPFAEALDQPSWVWVRYLLPALVMVAPAVALRPHRRPALALAGLSMGVVFLAKGLIAPFTAVNYWMYLHVPMFWLFREPMSKLGQLLVVFFGVLLAFVVESAAARVPTRSGPRLPSTARVAQLATAGAVCGVLMFPFPLLTGAVMPDIRPAQPSAHVRVPAYWWQMADLVDSDPRPGKVLVLPLDDYYQMPTTWGFFGVDSIASLLLRHPVVQRHPDGYFGDVPGFAANVQAVETALVSGDLRPVRPLLDALGVSMVILRHDLIHGLPGRNIADDRTEEAALARVPGLTRTHAGPLDLWRVGDGTSPTVRMYDELLDAPSTPAGVAAAIGSSDTHRAMAARPPVPPTSTTPTVDHSPSVAGDVITWPVPAVDRGPARTTVQVDKAGRFSVSQRARAAAVLSPSWDARSSSVLLSDPTAVRVDGRVVSTRPDLRVHVAGARDPVAVRAGTRTVSLDGWGARDNGPATLPVAAATPVTVFAPSRTPARPSPFSEVYDCNNYEPRPARELGLTRTVRGTGTRAVVRLSAFDHAACTRVSVPDARPGRTYRIRLQYRAVQGKRPQVCLWQTGTDGCELAARPVIGRNWTSYERFVTIDSVADGLQVVLHADVGQRLLGRTVSEYRGLRIEAVDPVHRESVWPAAVPPRHVALSAGPHTITVTGGPAGSVLAPFEPLQDCFRYDDQTPQQAGLFAKMTSRPGEPPAFSVGAREHMACVGATAPGYGASALYELSYAARSVTLRDPKVCLYGRGPDRCATLPVGGPWKEWTRYGALVSPDPSAVETRVYLYGLRDLLGQESSRVDYRAVLLRPVASSSTVVLVRDTPRLPATGVTWDQVDPAHVRVSVPAVRSRTRAGAGAVVALAETTAPGWTLPGGGEHVAVQGWMNAWRLTGPVSGQMAYAPADTARLALSTAAPVAGATVLSLLTFGWRRRRRERRRERRRVRRLGRRQDRRARRELLRRDRDAS